MKTYKYSTKERAERVSKTLGCIGSHSHGTGEDKKFMPCKDMETFKEKTKKETKGKEQEMTELVDGDGTWSSSDIPILDPASSMQGSSFTDKIVAMSRMPRDPLLRGWYGYYGESELKETDMSDAFGYHDTMFMDYDETVSYFQKKLGLDKESAIERTVQQGKKPKLHKKTPKRISKLKNYIDRLILKEKEIDESEIAEDILVDKTKSEFLNKKESNDIDKIILKNITSLKKMARSQGITTQQLIRLISREQ
jgi:hypothetical protein